MKSKSYIPLIIILFALFPLYFFINNSFSGNHLIAAIVIKSLATLFILNFPAYYLGGLFFKAINIEERSFHLKRLYKFTAGYGIIFISLMFLGLFKLYTSAVLNVYIVILTVLAIFGIYNFIKDLPVNASCSFSGVQTLFISMIVFITLLDMFVAFVPPTVRDSLIHHLAVPKLYLKKGGIYPLDFMTFSFRSINLELLYILPLFIKNDIGARLIHFNFYVLSIIALYHFLRDAFNVNVSLIGTLLFAFTPVVFNVASSAYVDLGLVFFSIMLINAARQFYLNEDMVYLKLAGIAAGITISTKINGYLFVALVFIYIITITQRHKAPLRKMLAGLAIFLLFTFIFDFHLIAKNVIQRKNPFYPAISLAKGETYEVGGKEVELSQVEIRKLLYNQTPLDDIMLPWALSTEVNSRMFYTVDGVLGPVFIIFIPFFVFIKKRRHEMFSFFLIAGAYILVCWAKFSIRLRYLMVLFPIGVFLLCAVIDSFFYQDADERQSEKILKGALYAIISVIIALNLYHIFNYVSIKEPFPFLSSNLNREQYLKKHYRQYNMFNFINDYVTDKDALIYFLDFGNDGYYCDVGYIYDSTFLGKTFEVVVKESRDSWEIFKRLRDMGITHILLNINFLKADLENNYDDEQRVRADRFFSEHLKMIKEYGDEKFLMLKEKL